MEDVTGNCNKKLYSKLKKNLESTCWVMNQAGETGSKTPPGDFAVPPRIVDRVHHEIIK